MLILNATTALTCASAAQMLTTLLADYFGDARRALWQEARYANVLARCPACDWPSSTALRALERASIGTQLQSDNERYLPESA